MAKSEKSVACMYIGHKNFLSAFEVTEVFPWSYCVMDKFESIRVRNAGPVLLKGMRSQKRIEIFGIGSIWRDVLSTNTKNLTQ